MSTQSDIQALVNASGFCLRGASNISDSGSGGVTFTSPNGIGYAAGKVDSAGFQFTRASSHYLRTTSSRGKFNNTQNFTLTAWVKVAVVNNNNPWGVGGNFNGVGSGGFVAAYDVGSYGLFGRTYDSGGLTTAGNTTPQLSMTNATWGWVHFWYRAVDKTLGIELNNTTAYTNSFGGTLANGTDLILGAIDPGLDWLLDGQLSEVIGGQFLFDSTQKAYLYNSGNGTNVFAPSPKVDRFLGKLGGKLTGKAA